MGHRPKTPPNPKGSLRKRAETVWKGQHRKPSVAPHDVPRLAQELEIHQVELELQNEELRRAQREIEESRNRLSELYNLAPVGYLTLNKHNVIVQANLKAESLLGAKRNALTGHLLNRFIAPESRNAFFQALCRADVQSLSLSCETILRKADGAKFPVSMEIVGASEPGGPLLWRCTFTDITQRRHAEEELRKSEERFRRLVEVSSQIILVTDPQGLPTEDSFSWSAFTGRTHQQMIGWNWLDAVHPEDRVRVAEAWKKAVVTGGPFQIVMRLLHHSGEYRHVSSQMVNLRKLDGSVREWIGTITDITERMRMVEELEGESRRKDLFLSLLGHELRNPLAAISFATDMLSADVTEKRRASLEETIVRQVALLRRLVEDLLDLARITHGQITLKREPVDLAKLLRHVADSSRSFFRDRGQKLDLRLPSDRVLFMADGMRLEQIAVNLLSNASKYTARGGRIEFSGATEGSEVVIRCKDNGRGIPLEMQESIFEPFTRGPLMDDSHGEASLGIGLTLVKQLVELHGGTVSAKSGGADGGSEFVVRLPLLKPPRVSPPRRGKIPTMKARRPLSIVIVEDNLDVARTMEIALQLAGHEVTCFADGPSALAGLSELKPDVAIIDIGLPGMGGYELAAKLRQSRNLRHCIFVATSGLKQLVKDAELARNFDRFLPKPVDLSELLKLIRKRARPRRTLPAARGTSAV